MIIYLFIYVSSTILWLLSLNLKVENKKIILGFSCVFFLFFIGLRDGVGADWVSYIKISHKILHSSFLDTVRNYDLGYIFLVYLSNFLGLGIYGVNFFCALIICCCLYFFLSKQNDPLFILTISIPIFILILCMGFSRQGVAISLILLVANNLSNKQDKPFRSILLAILAISFHKTAIVFLGVMLIKKHHLKINLFKLITLITLIILITLVFHSHIEFVISEYITSNSLRSKGVVIRAMIPLLCIMIFYIFRKKYQQFNQRQSLYLDIASLYGIFFIILLICLKNLSTLVDRFLYYLIPMEFIIFSALTTFFTKKTNFYIKLTIITMYGVFLFGWLSLSFYAQNFWIPYKIHI